MMALFAYFQHTDSVLPKLAECYSLDSNTCFDHHGCQQGDETGTPNQHSRGEELYADLQA